MIELGALRYMFVDVDGTMTDGGIYYDCFGNEIKKFNTRDAAAFFCLSNVGIKTVVATGRICPATERRMTELGVEQLYQDVDDKRIFLERFIKENEADYTEIGYIGDDLNDYEAMSVCGFKACPSDACEEIRHIADYISGVRGGEGAIRDIVRYVLKERGQWDCAIKSVYRFYKGNT